MRCKSYVVLPCLVRNLKKVEQARRARREILLGHLAEQEAEPASEQDVLDSLTLTSTPATDIGQALESDEEVAEMLSLVSPADQEVLRLGVLEGLDRDTLAQRLGIAPGTARMRRRNQLRRHTVQADSL
jgi:DNA-directed RNA polymerase specialized sigma24 family protein